MSCQYSTAVKRIKSSNISDQVFPVKQGNVVPLQKTVSEACSILASHVQEIGMDWQGEKKRKELLKIKEYVTTHKQVLYVLNTE